MSGVCKRNQIIQAADQLFYQQGFEHTSFAHIAEEAKISSNNFYYHFKTKNDILDALINLRLTNTEAMISQWGLEGNTPGGRIISFINILIRNQVKIKRFGCPQGTVTTELNKLEHLAQNDANKLFTLSRSWLKY